jgi:hypothetical protein
VLGTLCLQGRVCLWAYRTECVHGHMRTGQCRSRDLRCVQVHGSVRVQGGPVYGYEWEGMGDVRGTIAYKRWVRSGGCCPQGGCSRCRVTAGALSTVDVITVSAGHTGKYVRWHADTLCAV